MDMKIDGEKHYKNKFINRCVDRSRRGCGRSEEGNSTSLSYGRGACNIKNKRKFDLGPNKQICDRIIIDYKKFKKILMSRKSIIHQSVEYIERTKINEQKQMIIIGENKKVEESKMISLFEINEKMYIGNKKSIENIGELKDKNIEYVINVSNSILPRMLTKEIKCINIDYKDTRNMKRNMFIQYVNEVANIMLRSNGNVLIICDKCVNRSPSIAIGYAIKEKNMKFNEVNNYVEDMKQKVSNKGSHLTNNIIRNILKSL